MKKRSRNARSTSLADVLLLDLDVKRTRDVTTALSLDSFSSCTNTASGVGILKSLDDCRWCRKWISPSIDVYMYAGFAYCTEKCREWQYEKDAKAGMISPVRNADMLNKSLVKTTAITLK